MQMVSMRERFGTWSRMYHLSKRLVLQSAPVMYLPIIIVSILLFVGVSLKRKYDSTLSTGEGADMLAIISDERLQHIDEFMTLHRVALLRSPPESGKTTLSVLFREYLEKRGHYVVNISMLDLNGTRKWGM